MRRLSASPKWTQPLFTAGGWPILLTHVLLALHILALLGSVVVGAEAWNNALAFRYPESIKSVQVWRFFSYLFVHEPLLSVFLLDMIVLVLAGVEIERSVGRWGLLLLYVAATVLRPVLHAVAGMISPGLTAGVVGTFTAHFALLTAWAMVAPQAATLTWWLTRQWFALGLFLVHFTLCMLGKKWVDGICLLLGVGLAWAWLRRAGLLIDAMAHSRRSAAPNGAGAPRRRQRTATSAPQTGPKYTPKIRPRAELAIEHPAVAEVDALLEKIARDGIASLSPREREQLEKASAELKARDDSGRV